MEEISKDRFVIIEYTVRLDDGTFVKGEDGPVSMNFIIGYAQIMPALERRLLGHREGEDMEFTIPAREAFGPHDPAQLRTRSFSDFPEGKDLQAGKWVRAHNEFTGASYAYFVKEKTDEGVVLDYNHPLAGKDLHYRVRIVRVREALQEELEYLRPCEFKKEDAPATGTIG